MSYKIIADSSADLLALDGVEFQSVPLKISTDKKEYVDDAALDVAGMIADLQKHKGQSKSSCPNVGEWKESFGDHDNLFCVTITSNLSGSYNAAEMAMREYLSDHPDRNGYVIDTLSVGPESVLIIEKLRELINSGHPFEEIREKIISYKKNTHLIFCLDSLRNLANNGRVSHAVAKVAGILGIRIVGKASNEGTLEITDKVRGADKAISAIFKNMLATGFKGGTVRIHHCQNPASAETLANMIKAKFHNVSIRIQETRALCSFYAESGGLLVGYEGASK